jgi:hypothetical protein
MITKRITVYDIAERLGCSHATVSMALRNHPSISTRRREQVKRMAEEIFSDFVRLLRLGTECSARFRRGKYFGPWEELGNPCIGSGEQTANTFQSQGTFILPVQGRPDAFIFMADRWNPKNAIDGRYVWLPIEFHHGVPMFRWHDEWDLSFLD